MATVVVVDDDSLIARMHARMLEILGYEAHEFRSPAECLEWLDHNRADLGLFDLAMRGTDGVELLEELQLGGRNFPVIFVTGEPAGHLAREARQAGATAVVGKPLSMDILQALVEATPGLAGSHGQLARSGAY